MLTVSNLSAGYGDIPVLQDVSFELKEGSITVLMGPNGAGKSTLLKALYGLTSITNGSVTFLGNEITTTPTHCRAEHGLGFVPQGRINFGLLTVAENLRLGAYHLHDEERIQKNIEAMYETFPVLKKKSNGYAFSLSGGEQQMLAIARALVNIPRVLFLDEPSLGLSPKLVKDTFATIAQIKERFGLTVLIVEHNIRSVLDIANRGIIMVDGAVIADDDTVNLKNSNVLRKVFVGAFD
jgi:branched-chain amino acid transport system ATP-binding protein